MSIIRKVIKPLIPPIFLKFFPPNYRYGFQGKYSSWEIAEKKVTGYDSNEIIEKVKKSALEVKSGNGAFERDGVLYKKIEYSWPLLASLLYIASQNNNNLNLLDFGGSLGSSYYQHINFLKHLNLNWSIVEQAKFVEYGKKLFENGNLKFYFTIEECLDKQNPNVLLFSNVIQYLEKPYELLEKIVNINIKYVIFEMTTFQNCEKDFITVQKVTPKIYDASYPCWIFNCDNFLSKFQKKYNIVAKFYSHNYYNLSFKNIPVEFAGYLLKLKK